LPGHLLAFFNGITLIDAKIIDSNVMNIVFSEVAFVNFQNFVQGLSSGSS
jgi:hypothetical protein